jgi:hypothetical protein
MNTGTFMGYKDSLLTLLTDILASLNDPVFIADLASEGWFLDRTLVDQAIISYHLYKYWTKYDIAFDRECRIFYIPCGDWENIDRYIDYNFRLTETGQKPSIIHVTNKSQTEHVLQYLFNNRYHTPLANKRYSWEHEHIFFNADGTLWAFGPGTYKHFDSHTVRANFGNKIHTLHFNGNFTEFVSIRSNDNNHVYGKLASL